MYHGNKSHLLKIFNPTHLLHQDILILDFSVIVNSQVAFTTAKIFNEFADGITEFVNNLPSGCSQICQEPALCPLKSHTCQAHGCGQFFPFIEATNIPKDFQDNFLRHNRNKVALNSFLTGKLLTHDFGGAILVKKFFILDAHKRMLILKSLSSETDLSVFNTVTSPSISYRLTIRNRS